MPCSCAQNDAAGALAGSRKLWFRSDEMPDSCTPLFDGSDEAGCHRRSGSVAAYASGVGSGNTSLAKRLIKYLPRRRFSGFGVEMAAESAALSE